MKFQAKIVGLLAGSNPIIGASIDGAKEEYPDAEKISLTSKANGLIVEAHNGNVAATADLSAQVNIDYVFSSEGTVTVDSRDYLNTLSSFEKDEIIDVELIGNELVFIPLSNTEKLQSVPAEVRQIEMPPMATSGVKETKVNKESLLEATKKTLYSIGFEKFKAEFLYWKLTIEPKMLRVFCGDGGRFAVYQAEGDNIVVDGKSASYLFYKDQNPALVKVLSTVDSDCVTIREYRRDNDSDPLIDQFVVVVGNVTLVMIGHDPGVSQPDATPFLSRKSNYKFVIKESDWVKEFSGTMATNNANLREQNQVHFVYMTFDTKKGVLTLRSESTMRSIRKVKITDSWVESGFSDIVETRVISSIIKDAFRFSLGGNVQMELIDGKAPIVLRYFVGDTIASAPIVKVDTASGITETYTSFFGAYNKK